MSGRRGDNRIRGPQSALTDFLAANNISAQQIRDDYESRARQLRSAAGGAGEGSSNQATQALSDADLAASLQAQEDEEEQAQAKSKKRKRAQDEAIESIKKAKSKKVKRDKKDKKKKKGSDDEDDDDWDLSIGYKKAPPAPGQFEHCEICDKRFTVTPYSKEGPNGGLVCTPCGKEIAKDMKAEKQPARKSAGGGRRKNESNRLDGVTGRGSKTLVETCIQKLVQHPEDIEGLGDIPEIVLGRVSQIFSKKRVLKSNTLPLFLRPDLDSVVVHEAAYLEVDDYRKMFAVVPNMRKLVLANACQLKDEGIEYMLDRCHEIRHLHLYAANLVTDDMWHRLFLQIGGKLETIKLKWLDAAFDDSAVVKIQQDCPNLQRLKLKLCRKIGEESVHAIAEMQQLQHISLQVSNAVSNDALINMIQRRGPELRTLSLERFMDLDDAVVHIIRDRCAKLTKLRITENDTVTDAAYAALFKDWTNPPLTFADFSSTRDVDNNNAQGPEEAIGLASEGFKAVMAHSGETLKHLDVASCRHIQINAFLDVFNETQTYPALEHINISFCNRADNSVVAGIFKSCPALKKLVAFGCFDIADVVVPKDLVLIGVPKAQDAIEQFGMGLDVMEAVGRMQEIAA